MFLRGDGRKLVVIAYAEVVNIEIEIDLELEFVEEFGCLYRYQ